VVGPDTLSVLYDAETIAAAVRGLAARLATRIAGKPTFVVPVMNGALFFAADLLRALPREVPVVGFGAACLSSYGAGTAPAGPPEVTTFPARERVEGRTVLVLDTILDTGATADAAVREARARGAADVVFCCLIEKPARRRVSLVPDACAFSAPDLFLVGYGLDASGRFRTLPYVAALARG
jgi:hypoxanthine phosphoribosyltransferase